MGAPVQRRLALAVLSALGAGLAQAAAPAPEPAAAAAQDETGAPVPVVVVSASRAARDSLDLPAAVAVVDAARIGAGQPRVNASEALAAVPGLVALNRQNYAQDLQISSRGFGARSAFGVRGVRLVADGIPATMPDGQGQAATFNLDLADRIEVLRGPFSALYGNHAGGVILMLTRDGAGPPSVETTLSAGSYGSRKVDLNAQGESGGVGYVIDASRFDTDGYRAHSAARRDQSFAKLSVNTGAEGKLTLTGSSMSMNNADDPLGVKWSTFERDPRAGEADISDPAGRSFAERYDTRKNINHRQGGVSWEGRLGAHDRLQASVYGGNRHVVQYQSFSRSFQAPASHSGGVVDFARDFYGANLAWQHATGFAGGELTTTAGIEYGRSEDDRQGYENFAGERLGVRGALRRDETDTVSSVDPYLQAAWDRGPWQLSGGLRYSRMRVAVHDAFWGNGNDSGSLRFGNTTPALGLLYRVNPALKLYASAARGFEAPTLNELFYSGAAGGFNYTLAPATSRHLELGAKALVGHHTRAELALFQVRTEDELVVDVSSGGRSSYRNGGKTLRQGLELSLDTRWSHGLNTRLAATRLRAIYDAPFGAVPAGSHLPGVPGANLFGELAWKDSGGRFGAALEAQASGKIHVDDANAERAAPGYGVLNLRVHARQERGAWQFRQFARLNNLLDRQYVGSVIVGDSSKRYYEAAPGINWLVGVNAAYRF